MHPAPDSPHFVAMSDDLFAPSPDPRWFTIPSGRPFLDDLARGLCRALGKSLPEAQILTPTRRGARAMARAFSAQTRGGALLLPQIRAIGDLDEGEPPFDLEALGLDLPSAISSLRRRFELARLITDHYKSDISGKTALELADSLAKFFDSLALEEVDATDRLHSLVTGQGADQYSLGSWAQHWQVSAQFLAIAVNAWPKRLDELGMMDPSQRQVTLIRRLIDQWTEHPPKTPLILAGTTGSAPSTADLAKVVAAASIGAVVLPGLDLSLADDAWDQIEDSHPQATMKRMLDRHHVARATVRVWPVSLEEDRRKANARRRLLNEALRPAEATKDWREQIAALRAEDDDAINDGLDGLTEISAARDEEAATVIALLMRETLETPGKTVALVTPDQTLARRVSARLTRWGLQADSSAGEPLANSQTGRFLLDLLTLLQTPCDPVAILSLWGHPACLYAEDPGRTAVELYGLRGAKPNDMASVRAALVERDKDTDLWDRYAAAILPVAEMPVSDLGEAATRITRLAEALSLDDGQALWTGATGGSAAELLAGLIREGAGYTVESLRDVADILGQLIRNCKVRTGGNTHPRLLILGAIEARMVTADRLILAGLEEGVWPQAPDLDPFLSRPMRAALGLPSPERRTGLSAHDFVQAASAPETFLVTRHRREGEPQVQSRWLWRLQTLCAGAKVDIPRDGKWLDWARALDRGLSDKPPALKPAVRPNPKPPVAARPKQLSVTEVEVFVRDPYAIYAKHVLRLRPLDRPNEPVEGRQRGTAIHKSLERFVTEDTPLGKAGIDRLCDLLHEELAATRLSPAQMAMQKPLLPGMAADFIRFEADRRAHRPKLHIEQRGELKIGDFTLVAKADRIELRDDGVDILDFKTGAAPSAKAVAAGFYPQLTLTAAILKQGGFADIRADRPLGDLLYVRVSPDVTRPQSAVQKGLFAHDLADTALNSLRRRIFAYAEADKGYLSWIAPQFLKTRAGDYDQLARLYEWYVLGTEDAEDTAEEEA
ncbi:double-strand break repair protein AddB [Asticcacaulis sp. AC460]|nr:double-strand break repair protein AddB [Asticcacaulis sp. AC460]